MNRSKWIAGAVVIALCASALAGDTIYVDLSGIDTIVTDPPLTQQQKDDLKSMILADINANFAVAGVDITVTTDPNAEADRTVRLHPQIGSETDAQGGTSYFYGVWYDGSRECDVYLGNFFNRHGDDYKTNGQWDIDKLRKGIGRTAAHEVAHSYSVGHNRDTTFPTKMTEGGLVESSTRANTEWIFDGHSAEVMRNNLGHPPCQTAADYDEDFIEPVYWNAPLFPNPDYDPNDPNSSPYNDLDEWGDFDALLAIDGPMATLFDLGWYGVDTDGGLADGDPDFDFIYKASMAEPEPPELLTFFEIAHASAQFLLRGREGSGFDGQWYPMSDAMVTLADPVTTPAGDQVYRFISIDWDIDGDATPDVSVTLDSDMLYPFGAEYNGWRLRHIDCVGDLNADLTIDLADLAVLLANYNVAFGARYDDGDLDGDRDVDLADLATMLAVYGTDCPPPPYVIPPGDDCFHTPCDGATFADFADDPIPADFFAPGSETFTGDITFGSPSGAPADTILHRTAELRLVPDSPVGATTPIDLTQLNITSCDPVTIMVDGQPTFWDVEMTLAAPQPPGQMLVFMSGPDGGFLTADYTFAPLYIFTRTEPPHDSVIWDPTAMGIPPVQMQLASDISLPWSIDESFDACTIDGFAAGVMMSNGQPCAVPACADSVNSPSNHQCMRTANYPECP